jgi:carboxymethylenebutenolidase
VILFQEAFGVNDHIKDVARRLADLGYVTIAPELYHRTGEHVQIAYTDFDSVKPHREVLTDAALEADIRASYAWLTENTHVVKEKIGAIGFCMGGRAAYYANTFLPLSAAVSFYGANIAPSLSDRAQYLNGPLLLFWGGQDQAIPLAQRLAVTAALDTSEKKYVYAMFSKAGHGFHCDARQSYVPDAAKQAWALTAEFLKTNLQSE